MPKFCCKHCGMITDKPEITYAWTYTIRDLFNLSAFKGNYYIRCPICLKKTYFTRDEPFPTDEPTEMKQERCDDEHCFLPKGHEGLHQAAAIITDKEDNINLSSIPSRVV